MDESFDPYRKWLGIPPEEQPPHHYRLLGLELFEADPDVIVNAADARLSYLQSLAKDKHADMAERLAAQIKEVQLCLLDPAKKAFYDGQLQRRIAALKKGLPATAASNGNSGPAVAGGGTPQAVRLAGSAIPELQVPVYAPHSAHLQRNRRNYVAATILGLVAIGCLLVYLLVKLNSPGTSPADAVARADAGANKAADGKSAPSVLPSDSTAGNSTAKPNNHAADGSKIGSRESDSPAAVSPMSIGPRADNPDGPAANSSDTPGGQNTNEEPPLNIGSPPPQNSGRDAPPSMEHEPAVGELGGDKPPPSRRVDGARLPLPSGSAQQTADRTVREIYGAKIAAAKAGPEKIALADQIWRQALATRNDPALRYVLMTTAYQLTSESGRLQRALDHADMIADSFEANAWDLKLQAAANAVKVALVLQTARGNPLKIDGDEIVLMCMHFAEEAMQAGQVEVAGKVVKEAMPLAKKEPLLMRELSALDRDIERRATKFQSVQKALDTLKEQPDNPDANALAGRWACFESRDWGQGLPMLAKSSDAPLAELAVKDLAAAKGDDPPPLAVADAWWEYARKEKANVKAGAYERADFWYTRARPALNESETAKVDARLKEIADFADTAAASGRGAIALGNIALTKNGARVDGVAANAEKLLAGDHRSPGWDGGAANSRVPCDWTITFDKTYLLQLIRFHFYDADKRYYHYWMEISADGVNYKKLIDRNQGQSFQWQAIPLKGVPVKSVKLHGTFSFKNNVFSVTEFEAYCIPPKQ